MRYSNRQRFEIIHQEMETTNRLLARLVHLLETPRPNRIVIQFQGASPMPLTLSANQKVTATATEYDSAGTSITPEASSLQWKVSDETIASITTNPDGTAEITAIAEGSVTVSVTDAANNLTSSDVLTITPAIPAQPPTTGPTTTEPGKPVAIAITYGTPA